MNENKNKIQAPTVLTDQSAEALGRSLVAAVSSDMIGDCPDVETLAALVEGALAGEKKNAVMKHTAACSSCSEIFLLAGDLLADEPVHRSKRRSFALYKPLALAASLLVVVVSIYVFYTSSVIPRTHQEFMAVDSEAAAPAAPGVQGGVDSGVQSEVVVSGKAPIVERSRRNPLDLNVIKTKDAKDAGAAEKLKKELVDKVPVEEEEMPKEAETAANVAIADNQSEADAAPDDAPRKSTKRKFDRDDGLQMDVRSRTAKPVPKGKYAAAPKKVAIVGTAERRSKRKDPAPPALRSSIPKQQSVMQQQTVQQQDKLEQAKQDQPVTAPAPVKIPDEIDEKVQESRRQEGKGERRILSKSVDYYLPGPQLAELFAASLKSGTLPDLLNLATRCTPGSVEARFFELLRFGWCFDGTCYYKNGKTGSGLKVDNADDLLKAWRELLPELRGGIFESVAKETIAHLSN